MTRPIDIERDRTDILRTTAELLAAVNAGDVTRVLAVWAEDGVMMPPAHPAVRGRAALREYFGALFKRARLAFEFTSSELELDVETAFERVSYRVVVTPAQGDTPFEDAGKGLHVYRRQPDGAWRLCVDIWNSDRAVAIREDE